MENITDKVALVTGASRGIGAAIAKALAKEGVKVVINDKHGGEEAKKLAEEIASYGLHAPFIAQADVGYAVAVKQMFERVQNEYGAVDLLVNNAGVMGPVGAFEKLTLEALEDVFKTNFWGAVHTTQAALPGMKERKFGRLVYISNNLPEKPCPGIAGYTMSKAALNGLALQVATEVGAHGITSNTVVPGLLNTDLGRKTAEKYLSDRGAIQDQFMIPELNTPEAVADAVVTLCKSPYLTAQTMYVDNGWQRKLILPRKQVR
ncbi:SDR family oxidoreductase [Candidatus Woesearchaeota archaeon]|nr:SDR family oxidoreductase [Candidatus Woesearchaeota archaeon]